MSPPEYEGSVEDIAGPITREKFRPSISQNELLPVRVEEHLCAICGGVRGVGDHHVTFRSRGGEEGPTVPVDEECHSAIHRYEWELSLEEDGMFVYDREGDVVWRLIRWPLPNGAAGEFLDMLQRVNDALPMMKDLAPALLPYEAIEWHSVLRQTGEQSWKATVRLIGEMWKFRMPGKSPDEKVTGLSQSFGLRRSQLYNVVMLYEVFGDSDLMEQSPLGQQYFLEAARSIDPVKWLGHAEERKLTYPTYSRDDLKQDIARSGERRSQDPPIHAVGRGTTDTLPPPGKVKVWGKCPSCEYVGYLEKLPMGAIE